MEIKPEVDDKVFTQDGKYLGVIIRVFNGQVMVRGSESSALAALTIPVHQLERAIMWDDARTVWKW